MNKKQHHQIFFIKILIFMSMVGEVHNNLMTVDLLKNNINGKILYYNKIKNQLKDHFFIPGIKYRFLNVILNNKILNNKKSYEANGNPEKALIDLLTDFSNIILKRLKNNENIDKFNLTIDEFFTNNPSLKDPINGDYNVVLQESEFLRKELALFLFNKVFNIIFDGITTENIDGVNFAEVEIIWNILFSTSMDKSILEEIRKDSLLQEQEDLETLLKDIPNNEDIERIAKDSEVKIKKYIESLLENIKKNINAYYKHYTEYIKKINDSSKEINSITDLKTIMEILQKDYQQLKQYEFLNSVFLIYKKQTVTVCNFIDKANNMNTDYEAYDENLLKSNLDKISLTIRMLNELNGEKENNPYNSQKIKPVELIEKFKKFKDYVKNIINNIPVDMEQTFDINNGAFLLAKNDYKKKINVEILESYTSIENHDLDVLIDFFKSDDFTGKSSGEYHNLDAIETIITKINIQWFTEEFNTIKKQLEENASKIFQAEQKAKESIALAEAQRLKEEDAEAQKAAEAKRLAEEKLREAQRLKDATEAQRLKDAAVLAEAQRLQQEEAERQKQLNLKNIPQELPKTSEKPMAEESQEKAPKKLNNNKKNKKSDLEKESMANKKVWFGVMGITAVAATVNEIKKQMRKRDEKQKNKQTNRDNKQNLEYQDNDMDDKEYLENENPDQDINNNQYMNNEYQPNQNLIPVQ